MGEKVVVYHGYYGCDTGCCGHVVEMGDRRKFDFTHPWSADDDDEPARRHWAEDKIRREFGDDHVADLDWENCHVSTAC